MNKRFVRKLIMLVCALCVGLYSRYLSDNPVQFTEGPQSSAFFSEATQSAALYPVTRVVDGDTIKISMKGKEETVRLLGVDTPELVDPRKSVQCFAKEASEETKRLLTGISISLEIDPTQGERDKYGRLLAYVLLPDGTNVSDHLIRNGFAHEYTYENNPHRYQTQFRQAQKEARENKRGLWAEGVCL
jgi:micrococcal nuclease